MRKYNRNQTSTANFFQMPNLQGLRNLRPGATTVGAGIGTVAGGVGGALSAPEDASLQDRIGRGALGAGVGAAAGIGGGMGYNRFLRKPGMAPLNQQAMLGGTPNRLALPAESTRTARARRTNQTAAAETNESGRVFQGQTGTRGGLAPEVYSTDPDVAMRYSGQYKANVELVASFYSNPKNYRYFN